MKFELTGRDGAARRGHMTFRRGVVETPAFMPVGTYGTVKAVTPEELRALGSHIILGNTFHLMLRPGVEVIEAHGGLHEFMGWDGPILTDSGGFQVWSLETLRKISEEGVEFRSPVDGDLVNLTPERSIEVQHRLNADIVMVFDECTTYPIVEADAKRSMELSLRWAKRSRTAFDALKALALTQTPPSLVSCRGACSINCAMPPSQGSPRSVLTAMQSVDLRLGNRKLSASPFSKGSSHPCPQTNRDT